MQKVRTCVSERNNHLLAALQFAAYPAGRIWPTWSTPTRRFRGRDANTATAGSLSVSRDPHYSPPRPSVPLWPNKPAFSPSHPRRSASLRGSCRGGGTAVAGLPPGPCCRGSPGYQGAACWSPLTWRGRIVVIDWFQSLSLSVALRCSR